MTEEKKQPIDNSAKQNKKKKQHNKKSHAAKISQQDKQAAAAEPEKVNLPLIEEAATTTAETVAAAPSKTATSPQPEKPATLTITIDNGQKPKRVIHLSSNVYRYGLASLFTVAALMVVVCCIAGYLLISRQSSSQTIEALQKANAVQQQQLTELAQKASQLQKQLDKLNSDEREIASLSNLAVDTKPDPDAKAADNAGAGGQGGPWIAPDYQNISAIFNDIEKRIKLHEDNLALLRQALLAKRQQTAAVTQKTLTTPTGWPANGTISSPYGFRWHGTDFHPGVDIAADYGTPIRATAAGVVTAAGWNSGGYGNMVDINHGHGLMTRYGHASSVIVHIGQHVSRGQVIAYVGSTGYSTGPHVHYEVRLNGHPIDPMPYL